MKEAGIEADIVEDGKTFEENALIKARTIRDLTRLPGAGGRLRSGSGCPG